MSPSLALSAWLVCLIGILLWDPAEDSKTSIALWLPVLWMFFLGSRNPGQWLAGPMTMSAQAVEGGSPLDQAVFSMLMLLSLATLFSRSFSWGRFLANNKALVVFLFFALASMCWSDFPLITVKRWFRDLGNYLVVLVVLSDPNPLQAVRTVLRRLAYLLVPLSIVLNKYYPALGREYDPWSGVGYYVGVATSKNMLGLLCLISGLFFFWDTITRWPERKSRRGKRVIAVNAAFFALTVWLLDTAQSTTSDVCLILGCLVIACTHIKAIRRNPKTLKALIPISFIVYLILDFGLGMNGSMAQAVGKDPTLTDRTKIWAFLLSMHTDPILGTGYQSFWLGQRLATFWQSTNFEHLNEAHNGYLEIYLELGISGVSLLVIFLLASYRNICARMKSSFDLGILGLALWLALVFYNMSEAAFDSGLLYAVFLMSALAVPARTKRPVLLTKGAKERRPTVLTPQLAPVASTMRREMRSRTEQFS
jgi:exopolysaccharide production protein ExoQ